MLRGVYTGAPVKEKVSDVLGRNPSLQIRMTDGAVDPRWRAARGKVCIERHDGASVFPCPLQDYLALDVPTTSVSGTASIPRPGRAAGRLAHPRRARSSPLSGQLFGPILHR